VNYLVYLILMALMGGGVEGKVEQQMAAHLQSSLGPIQKLQVSVDRGHRSPFSRTLNEIELEMEGFKVTPAPGEAGVRWSLGKKVAAGQINKIQVAARRFEVAGLPVQELKINLEGLRYNFNKLLVRRQLEIVDIKRGEGEILLQEKDLNGFLAPRVKDQMENFSLDLRKGEVAVTGRAKMPVGLAMPFTLVAELQPRGGQVYLVKPYLKASIVPLPSFISQRVVKKLNPILDLNQQGELPCVFNIRQIQVGAKELSARADLLFPPDKAGKTPSSAKAKIR
jgi:hypothetical protein